MNQKEKIKVIFFDFDGVILDSLKIREKGFREIFVDFKRKDVDELITFHRVNGGLSRFVKIQYFFKNILNKDLDENSLNIYAEKYSMIMRNELGNKKYLIIESLSFIKKYHRELKLHIVSGSEHNELNYLCKKLKIHKYFISINGSPTFKYKIISSLIKKHDYKQNEIIMIGDSINDYNAAVSNKIKFYGYNNKCLESVSDIYIESFKDLKIN